MNREAFDHAIRAAAGVLGEQEILVIGSQAIHAAIPGDLPDAALRSVEVDVVALDDFDDAKADLVDGAIGEASMFHETFGYYAQGVSRATAILPDGWEDRLIRYETPATNGVVAWCLEPHDLWVSKAMASQAEGFRVLPITTRPGRCRRAPFSKNASNLSRRTQPESQTRKLGFRPIRHADPWPRPQFGQSVYRPPTRLEPAEIAAENDSSIAGRRPCQSGWLCPKRRSDVRMADFENLDPVAGRCSQCLAPFLDRGSPCFVDFADIGRSHDHDIDVALGVPIASCE